MAILAAVITPNIAGQLTRSKKQAYDSEKEKIQKAVDGYVQRQLADDDEDEDDDDDDGVDNADDDKHLGKNQYPLIGRNQTDQKSLTQQETRIKLRDNGDPFNPLDESGSSTTALWNPTGGTHGVDLSAVSGTTAWLDSDSDGVRPADGTEDTWTTVEVTRGHKTYYTDPRYFFIDFEELIDENFLKHVPESAAPDNKPKTWTNPDEEYNGHYIWYVDDKGEVQSLYKDFPADIGHKEDVFP